MPEPENYGLPFDYHYTEAHEQNPPCVIVWTTTGPEDADTIDHVAVVDVPKTNNHYDEALALSRSLSIAEFVADALNAYAKTTKGREHWLRVYPLLPSNNQPTN